MNSPWESALLGDLLEFITTGSRGWAKYYRESGDLFLRIQNVGRNRMLLDDVAYVAAPQTTEATRTLARPGDVLMSMTADLGRSGVVPDGLGKAYINQHLAILRVSGVDPAYLSAFLASPAGQVQIFSRNRGQVKAGLNFDDVRSFRIPLPPPLEQKRISGILDAADALRAKRREALAQLDTLLQATFLDLFGDPVTNPKGWEVKTLEESGAKTKVGPFGSLLHTYDYIVGGVPLVNPKHMVDGKILHGGDETVSEEKASVLQDYRLKVGDLLVARRGEMGRCVIVHAQHSSWLCGTGSFYIRVEPNAMLSEFLAACISSQPMRKFLEHLSGGAIMPSLSGTQIKNLRIPIPPIDAQSRFVRASQAIVEQQRQQSEHLAELDTLFASLQSRAFRGEL